MKPQRWIATGVLCALCCLGASSSYGQKMYKEGEAIVLDCGPASGFPQGSVEAVKGTKIAVGTPSDTQDPMTNNMVEQSINATVYQKLEIAKENGSTGMTWANAYLYCQEQGEGWRLPTQREMILIYIFKDAVVGLGGVSFASASYWSSTEHSRSSSWYVDITYDSSNVGINTTTKTSTSIRTRCVREM